MIVAVTGGRRFTDRGALFDLLDKLHGQRPFDLLLAGGAQGVDTFAGDWARSRGVRLFVFYAQWKMQGKAAGPIRNARLLAEGKPDLLIRFPGGRGTADMTRRAEDAGVPIVRVE